MRVLKEKNIYLEMCYSSNLQTKTVDRADDVIYQGVVELKGKLNHTLQVCKEVVEKRTPYRITQNEIVIKPCDGTKINELL